MIELNVPKKVKRIILEDGEEIEVNSSPSYAHIDRWQILIEIPIRAEDWKKFFKDFTNVQR